MAISPDLFIITQNDGEQLSLMTAISAFINVHVPRFIWSQKLLTMYHFGLCAKSVCEHRGSNPIRDLKTDGESGSANPIRTLCYYGPGLLLQLALWSPISIWLCQTLSQSSNNICQEQQHWFATSAPFHGRQAEQPSWTLLSLEYIMMSIFCHRLPDAAWRRRCWPERWEEQRCRLFSFISNSSCDSMLL